jgi:nascent polypeptide-associated complex subunit alpha
MIPGMDMRQLKKLMQDVKEIPAERVIIEGPKRYIVENPKVMRLNVMGQDSLQITGNIKEIESKPEISDADIKMIMEQTGASEVKVREALIKNDNDIAKTILDLEG